MEIIVNNEKYIVNPLNAKEALESDVEYSIRVQKCYEESTHWLCQEDKQNQFISSGNVYPFYWHKDYQQFVIIADNSEFSMEWLLTDGELLIKVS